MYALDAHVSVVIINVLVLNSREAYQQNVCKCGNVFSFAPFNDKSNSLSSTNFGEGLPFKLPYSSVFPQHSFRYIIILFFISEIKNKSSKRVSSLNML